jgi:RNA polymerase sigma factor (sigma-70 family)
MAHQRASDAALVTGFGLNDPAAATEFVRRFQSRVYGFALTLTRDRALAEDIAQETFVRAWKSAATYDPGRAAVSTWLLTITRNLAIDTMRTRRPMATEPHLLEEVLHHSLRRPDESGAVDAHLDSDQALRRLAALHPEQARAVVLAVIAGCTAREVSEHEGIPLGTAKTRLRTGLRRLREVMRAESAADGS